MQKSEWWKSGVVYQVYPRSFMDTNDDGVGDIPGVTRRLDYLAWLGVDAIWLSPFFPSPMKDFGYDVSDYRDVDPIFGTLDDFRGMLREAHARSIRVIIDLVPNHTSDEHEWFVESRSSRENPKRDWYVWRDANPDGSPPNNWESIHGGGSAWEWDDETGQFYLHTFQTEQPDLDWHNPEVREAIYDAMRFWLDMGVDGFRIDALPCVAKDEHLRDNPVNPDWHDALPLGMKQRRINSEDGDVIRDIIRQMRSVTDEYEGYRVLIGEAYLPLKRLMTYYGEDLDGLHLPYNFGLVEATDWTPDAVRAVIKAYEAALPPDAGANWVLGNHDNPRVATRIGEDKSRVAQMLLLTLRGSPTIYYGDEIGMSDVEVPPNATQDPQGIDDPAYNRDPARTPMQWDATRNAGFSTTKPWLPIPDTDGRNVESQARDARSMLSLTRALISLRRKHPALATGDISTLDIPTENVLAFVRGSEKENILVALNFGPDTEIIDLSALGESGDVLLSTMMDSTGEVRLSDMTLRPDEGVVVSVKNS